MYSTTRPLMPVENLWTETLGGLYGDSSLWRVFSLYGIFLGTLRGLYGDSSLWRLFLSLWRLFLFTGTLLYGDFFSLYGDFSSFLSCGQVRRQERRGERRRFWIQTFPDKKGRKGTKRKGTKRKKERNKKDRKLYGRYTWTPEVWLSYVNHLVMVNG